MKKETLLNLLVSVFSNLILLAMGLIIPRVLLTHYGSDINGLISTITQIFSYVALLEAGIGQATLNALYKPLREKNKESLINVLYSSRCYYRKITYIYAGTVLLLSFILPTIINTDLGYWTVFFSVLFEGASSVVLFYFIQTQSILLSADGKTYIRSIIDLIIKIGGYGLKIVLALVYANIVYIQLGFFVLSLIKLVFYRKIIKKYYPWIDYNKRTNKSLKLPSRNDYIVTEVAWTIFSSTDLIVLSMFASTKMSSVYSVNNMPFLALNNLLNAAYYGIYYLLGKAYYKNMDEYKRMHDSFNSFFMATVTIFMCTAVLLADSFIKLYTNGVTDIEYNMYWLPVCFCLIQILSWSRYVAGNLSGIAGYARRISYLSLLEAAVNVMLSIVLVNILGLYGVVIATIVALPIKVVYTNYLADRIIMNRSLKKTMSILIANYLLFAIAVFIRTKIHFAINNYFSFMKYGFGLFIVISIIVFIANIVVNKKFFCVFKSIIRKKSKHR